MKTTPYTVDISHQSVGGPLNFTGENEADFANSSVAHCNGWKRKRLQKPLISEDSGDASMNDGSRYHLTTALQCIVLAVLDRYREHFAQLHADAAAADRSARLRGERRRPEKSRIVEAYKTLAPSIAEELHGSIRAKQLKAYQRSGQGGFREVVAEFWETPESNGVLEEDLFKPFGKPPQHAIYLDPSELAHLRRSEIADNASPVVKPASPVRKPLPASMIPEVTEALQTLPDLQRPQQFAALRELAKFRSYRITDQILREAAKSAPVPRGRPRKR